MYMLITYSYIERFETGVYLVVNMGLPLHLVTSVPKRVFSLIMVGKSSVLHSRQWSMGPSTGGWGSSASTSLPVGSQLAGLFEDMQQLLVTVSTSRGIQNLHSYLILTCRHSCPWRTVLAIEIVTRKNKLFSFRLHERIAFHSAMSVQLI